MKVSESVPGAGAPLARRGGLAGGGGSELGGSQSRATLLVIGAEWAVVEWNRKAAQRRGVFPCK